MEYSRDLSARERMRMWFPNINVVMAAEFNGDLDLEKLSLAIGTMNIIHPLTRVKIILDESGKGVFSNEEVPPVPIIHKKYKVQQDLINTIQEELKVQWNFQSGPLLRLTILSSKNKHYLVFCGHHAICDGRSFIFLIHDLLDCYANGIDTNSIKMKKPDSEENRLPAKVKPSSVGKLIINSMNKKWLAKGIRFNQNDYENMHKVFWKYRTPNVLIKTLNVFESGPFIKRCKAEKCTVNSAIYVAFLLSQMQVQGVNNKKILVPIDLRKYLNPPLADVFGYYASVLVIDNVVDGRRGFWDTTRRFENKVKNQMKSRKIFSFINTSLFDSSLLDAAIFAQNGMIKDDQANKLSDQIFTKLGTKLMVSNLGRVDIPKQFGGLELINIIPPVISSGNTEKVIETVTFNDQMIFSISYNPQVVSTENIENIFNKVKNTFIHLT